MAKSRSYQGHTAAKSVTKDGSKWSQSWAKVELKQRLIRGLKGIKTGAKINTKAGSKWGQSGTKAGPKCGQSGS